MTSREPVAPAALPTRPPSPLIEWHKRLSDTVQQNSLRAAEEFEQKIRWLATFRSVVSWLQMFLTLVLTLLNGAAAQWPDTSVLNYVAIVVGTVSMFLRGVELETSRRKRAYDKEFNKWLIANNIDPRMRLAAFDPGDASAMPESRSSPSS